MRTFGIRTALAAAAAFSCAACFAQTQQCNSIQTVVGSGRNAAYRTAVYEALVQAASQVQGVSLQDSRDAFMDSTAQLRKSKTDNADVSEVRESLKQTVSAKTKGRVLSYRVTGEKYITEMGLWFIELEAKVPGQYTVGLPEGNRRRMIAMPFDSLTSTVEVLGRTVKLGASCESIARRLNERLSQTRRFTMLDRAFDAKVKAELSRLNLDNASAGDAGRSQQQLVTDYMVTGTVKLYQPPKPVYNQYIRSATAQDGPFLEVAYSVILVPTSQLKWAGRVVVPYSACGGDTADAVVQSAFDAAAGEVCHEIVDNIYPLRVTDKTTFELVLNQGGDNYAPGQVFDVMRQCREVIDVTSNETLGASEEKVATIRITRVTPKMSYAVVVEGSTIDQIEVGAVVRRPQMVAAAGGPAAGAPSQVQVNPDGTVTPPWKK